MVLGKDRTKDIVITKVIRPYERQQSVSEKMLNDKAESDENGQTIVAMVRVDRWCSFFCNFSMGDLGLPFTRPAGLPRCRDAQFAFDTFMVGPFCSV